MGLNPLGEKGIQIKFSILALDLGALTGWAARGTDGFMTSGVQRFPLIRGDSAGMRFLRFRRWLLDILALTKANLVVYEAAISFHKSTYSGQLANGFAGIMQASCAELGLECLVVTAPELKRTATGKGNCGKDLMVAAAKRKFPDLKIIDDNHADALHLLRFAEEMTKAKG